jgi:dTDP-L-rhamnose 4-epimerase
MGKKILITGGAGFIGSHLVSHLAIIGAELVVLDNLSPQVHGDEKYSYSYNAIRNKSHFIKGDVRNADDWRKALIDVETIVHLAAETGTGQSMYLSRHYVDVNCQGTAVLADLLNNTKHTVSKIIMASSRAIYGEGKYACAEHGIVYPDNRTKEQLAKNIFECCCPQCALPLQPLPTDEMSRINPLSVYALTKYFQENMLQNTCKALNINYTALRFQNVYGPGQSLLNPYTGIISIFANRLRQNKEIFIFEDGKESRDFVFVKDVINAIELALNKTDTSQKNILNVGHGEMTSVIQIAEILRSLISPKTAIKITGQFRKGDIRHNFADLTLIENELKFHPKTGVTQGLTQFIEWLNKQEIAADGYEKSLQELINKGLLNKG